MRRPAPAVDAEIGPDLCYCRAGGTQAPSGEFDDLVFPDEVHSFLTHDHYLQAYRAAAGFIEARLREPE
ncbi:MAG: hypothetical protein WD063_20510 [Pirellulales bacterium]